MILNTNIKSALLILGLTLVISGSVQAKNRTGRQPEDNPAALAPQSGKINKFAIAGQVPAVVFSPGTELKQVLTGQQITLSSPTRHAIIYYTTDGSDPDSSATKKLYKKPFTLSGDVLIKAFATKTGMKPSLVTSTNYVLNTVFRNFTGACQGHIVKDVAGMRWNRADFLWGDFEPDENGGFSRSELDRYKKKVLEDNEAGISTLPILCYNTNWSANENAYSYTFQGKIYEYGAATNVSDKKFKRDLIIKDAVSGKILRSEQAKLCDKSNAMLNPAKVERWKNYVKMIVDEFSKAPYNIKYFQVWNEAYPTSGFWHGGLEDYINLVHKPAAEIIRKAGAKVVYGGWISGASSQEYVQLLNSTNSWNTIDVFDLHYHPLASMEYIYQEAKKHGISNPYIWQTEMGFSSDYTYPAVFYPKVFDWALSKWKREDPDQFKLFWFAYSSADKPGAYGYNLGLRNGTSLNNNGKELSVISSLLMGKEVQRFENFETSPALKNNLNENMSSVEAFLIDHQKRVFAFHIAKQRGTSIFTDFNSSGNSTDIYFQDLKIKIRLKNLAEGTTANRIDIFGNRTPLTPVKLTDGTFELQVPVKDEDKDAFEISRSQGSMITFYVELITAKAGNN